MRKLIPVVILPLAAAAALAMTPREASSTYHLRLLRSDPPADTTLTAAPTAIRLWFSQRVQLKLTAIRLTRADSMTIELAPAVLDTAPSGPVVAAVRESLGPAKYRVVWRTMASDGHVVRGDFAFTVKGTAIHEP